MMEVKFIENRQRTKTQLVQINDAQICFRNFRGEGNDFNKEGDRNFSIKITDPEIAEALKNDVNEFGAGWNVKIRAGREDGDVPFMHLPVKLKYTERSAPKVYLVSGNNTVELNERTIDTLDHIDIDHCDIDIRPYDGESRFGPHRTAYLQNIWVVQDLSRNRFASRLNNMED